MDSRCACDAEAQVGARSRNSALSPSELKNLPSERVPDSSPGTRELCCRLSLVREARSSRAAAASARPEEPREASLPEAELVLLVSDLERSLSQ